MTVLVNPEGGELGRRNAVLWGRGRSQYHVHEFPGPLSIKSIVRGSGEWRVAKSRFEVDSTSFLVLNDGQPYSLTIESSYPVETLCVFFERGFVEDAYRSMTRGADKLLDDPFSERVPQIGFSLRLWQRDGRVSALLGDLHHELKFGGCGMEQTLFGLALALIELHSGLREEIRKAPAIRSSTRDELFRRVQAGKQIMDGELSGHLDLASVARQAFLSPFHFHRAFKAVLGETPHEYIGRRRLEKAARLLMETQESVTSICLDVGLESLGSFSTSFRRRFGASPREFRRANPAGPKKFCPVGLT